MPYRYIERFIKVMYPPSADQEEFVNLAVAICHDSFFTLSNLTFQSCNIAMASILVAAIKSEKGVPAEESFDWSQARQHWADQKPKVKTPLVA